MAESKTETVKSTDWTIFELTYKKAGMLQRLKFKVPLSTEIEPAKWARERAIKYCNKRTLRFVACIEHLQDIEKLINFETDENWKG